MYATDKMTVKWNSGGKEWNALIRQDEMASNPRDEENLAVFALFGHKRYRLPQEDGTQNFDEFWDEMMSRLVRDEDLARELKEGNISSFSLEKSDDGWSLFDQEAACIYHLDSDSAREIADYMHELMYTEDKAKLCRKYGEEKVFILPVWMYEHSGISLSAGVRSYPYNDPWDSGCLGYAYVWRDVIEANFGHVDDWKAKAEEIIQSEIETYSSYLNGDCWGYELYSRDDASEEWEETDESCWGFYGNDLEENGMVDCIGHGLSEAIYEGRVEEGEARLVTRLEF